MAGKGTIAATTNADVPTGSGIPIVTSQALSSATDYTSLVASALESSGLDALSDYLTGDTWGLFDGISGDALFPDAVMIQIGGNVSYTISNAPIQDGSFVPYNKVTNPAQFQIGLSFQGSISTKAAQMSALLALADGVDLVTVRMPEWAKTNVSVVGVSFMRTARAGADLLMPVVNLQEARTYATTTYTTTKTGTSAVTEDTGTVQATQATTAQSSAIGS